LTLPVWVAAAAKAALQVLLGKPFNADQQLNQGPDQPSLQVPVCSAAPLADGQALGISRCDPGPGLDLTRDLEIWVRVAWITASKPVLDLQAGEGVGRLGSAGEACLSGFARELLERNLLPLLPPGQGLMVQPILPLGRVLAQRTSNAAFGVVDGLALIGTQAEVQRSAAPDQLQQVLADLATLAADPAFQGRLVLVIGENGLDLARQKGLGPLLKVGNWLGPVLVAAAEAGVRDLLLLGYHGKLIKLAGGIFHTHHHLADGRLEVLVALGLDADLSADQLRQLRGAASVEEAFQMLDANQASALGRHLSEMVERRSQSYVARYGDWSMRISAALFDRNRTLRWWGPEGEKRFFTLMD
jgi:cobalt-precorrin-5B (C1)-methyltransferase